MRGIRWRWRPTALAATTAFLLPVTAFAQAGAPAPTDAQIEALRRQLNEQAFRIDELNKALAEQRQRHEQQESRIEQLQRAQQAQGVPGQAAASAQPPAAGAQPGAAAQAAVPAAQPAAAAQAAVPAAQPQPAERAVQVGVAPSAEAARPVAQLFEQPGVLTPRGRTIFEPSLQYGYSSSNRAALVGFTVIPALLVGLVDVREVKRNSLTGAVTFRHGITNRFEVEARVPYVYRSDAAISREIFTGTAVDRAFHTSGHGIGDVEFTGRYQLTDGGTDLPYLIGSLRVKTRTGKGPFDVVTDCVTRCVGNTTGTGQPLDLPTGSGFYTVQPGLTWLYPSDPAVFFGSFTYGWNIKRSNVSRLVLGGEREFLGTVDPGDTIGINFGMGLALNDRSTFSIGMDLASIARTKQNGDTVPGSVRTQLATLLLGYSHRYNGRTTINVSVGAGLTRDTPDLTLTLRVPFQL